ncbi:sensor histidine kinase [Actinoplanes sp. HUAS TT8]|uniref:sensor histidine kinase n=1 Tax=Actinoplanes sp. HUAS TT8 TaxID=3447453 RepID=UPI003F521AA1
MSTRTRVITGLALLVALWVAAAVPAFTEARRVTSARTTATDLVGPAGALVLALETERRLSVAGDSASEMAAQRVHTDHARQELSDARNSGSGWLSGSDATRQADALLDRASRLPGLRTQVDAKELTGVKAADAYTALIDPVGRETPTVYPDQLGDRAPGLSALSRSRELLAEEDALLAAVSGQTKINDLERVRLVRLAGARRELLAASGVSVPATAGDELTTAEDAALAGKGGSAWSTAYNAANTALWELQNGSVRTAADAGTNHAVLVAVRAGVVGGVGLIAVIAVLLLAWRSGTGRAAPRRAAPRTAAPDRSAGLDPLLRDLERRNQGLVHRQLRLLDTLARRESDDDALGDLFRADHLANRMRRNLEKAIILSGGTPARRWHEPVPLTEVVRAAAAEISEYDRVSTARIEPVTLDGAAVTDLMHLLAELIENAATFGPAETRVGVSGEHLADGYRITVTDVGPGMTADDLATAARVMDEPDPPAGGTWWGLYATGRFAARHGIGVRLANGFDGGLVAEVVLPVHLTGALTGDNETTLDDLEAVTN